MDFVRGDTLDHSAPICPVDPARMLIVVERGRDARREFYPIPSLYNITLFLTLNARSKVGFDRRV